MRAARAVELPEQGRVLGRYRGLHRRTCGERGAPCGDFRQTAEDAEIANALEAIEITEHRTERRVNEAEALAIEPWTRQPRLDARALVAQRCGLRSERRLVRG